ncbi:MAG TPA: helix-turn-helix domain-containing protein [Thermoanaerobaculia bacterium]|nr:helix-turn-helix domain-containing protein [Thermoanaerobaculia bacterium]
MPRGRPRREGADEQILTAARALLRERGYREFTVDTVAERTGIAKTTIYRRWPSKGALVAALIAPPPESSDPDAIVRETAEVLGLLSEPDAEAIEVLHAVLAPRRKLLSEAFGSELQADLVIGALLSRLLVVREPVTKELAETVLRSIRDGRNSIS